MLNLKKGATISSQAILAGFVKVTADVSSTFTLYTGYEMGANGKEKGINPIRFRVEGANGNIAHCINLLAKKNYNPATAETRKETGIKLNYPPQTAGWLKSRLGGVIEPRQLCALLCLFSGFALPDSMDENDARTYIEKAGFSHLLETETDEHKEENNVSNRLKETAPVS